MKTLIIEGKSNLALKICVLVNVLILIKMRGKQQK
jgi:hypothetical protein